MKTTAFLITVLALGVVISLSAVTYFLGGLSYNDSPDSKPVLTITYPDKLKCKYGMTKEGKKMVCLEKKHYSPTETNETPGDPRFGGK